MKTYFRENLIKLMEERKLSMRAVSLAAGLSEGVVRKIIDTPLAHPRIDTAIKIAEGLRYDPAEMIFNVRINLQDDGHLDKEVFAKSIVVMDSLIEEHNIKINSEKKAHAYMLWYELDRLDSSINQEEKFNTVMRLVR